MALLEVLVLDRYMLIRRPVIGDTHFNFGAAYECILIC